MALNEGQVGEANERAERDPRIARLYRDAAREEPPARLDAAILAAARREVGAGPRSLVSKLRRWHVPISIAAVVVVSVSLVILVQEEESTREAAPSIQAIPAPAGKPAAPPAQPAPTEAAKEAMQRELDPPSNLSRQSRDDRVAAAMGKLAADSGPEPNAASKGHLAVPAGKPAPQLFLDAPQIAKKERAPRREGDLATTGRTASAPAAPGEPRAAPPREELRRMAPAAGAMATKAFKQDGPPIWQGFEQEPPEKWLARIEELKVQGRGADAQEMLSEFKRRFPEHPLPAGLK